jgi:hexokinase
MYLGEISRNILLHLIDSGHLFSGHSSQILNTHYGYDTAFVSAVEGAQSADDVRHIIIKDLKIPKEHLSEGCVELVRWACRIVSERACALAACAIAAVILHTGNDKTPEGEEDTGVDVGLDGR